MTLNQIRGSQIRAGTITNTQVAANAEIALSKIAGGVALDNRVTDLESDAFVTREVPSGSINGTNVTFTLANTPVAGSEQVFLNGLLQDPGPGNSYTISGAVITFASAPLVNDEIHVSYATGTYMVAPGGAGAQGSGASSIARVFTVGKDAVTIQGCIDLCTNPSLSNAYVILVPPGTYTENLTLKKQCHLQGLCNPNDTSTVKITGNHTYAGTDANAVNNRITFANIVWINNSATLATFALTATVATQINMSGCYFQNSSANTTAKIFDIGTNVRLYLNTCVSRMAGSGTGGTHFVVSGGTLYCTHGVDVDGGTRILDMTTAGYAQLTSSVFACNGTDAIRVVANGIVAAGYSSFTNGAATGNGVNLLGAGASMLAGWCAFDVQNSASTYVVTGVAGSSFAQANNNFGNIAGVLTRNVKIKNTVTLLNYTTSLTPSA